MSTRQSWVEHWIIPHDFKQAYLFNKYLYITYYIPSTLLNVENINSINFVKTLRGMYYIYLSFFAHEGVEAQKV